MGGAYNHGYYITGKESKQEATENLIKLLSNKLAINKKSRILDVGCGIGGTSVWLAKNYRCKVTGITISPVQVKMAKELSEKEKFKTEFLVSDANYIPTKKKYDIIWAVEVISHIQNRKLFLSRCSKILEKNGKLVIADWFREKDLDGKRIKRYITPIEKQMLVSLWTSRQYKNILEENGLKLRYYKDISSNVSKTWDVSLEIIKNKELWILAAKHGKEFTNFLKSFKSMKNGFNSGALRYEAMIFEK